MQVGYAVICQWWNGTTFSVDFEDVRVFLDKKVADQYAAEMAAKFRADLIVDVAEVTIQ